MPKLYSNLMVNYAETMDKPIIEVSQISAVSQVLVVLAV